MTTLRTCLLLATLAGCAIEDPQEDPRVATAHATLASVGADVATVQLADASSSDEARIAADAWLGARPHVIAPTPVEMKKVCNYNSGYGGACCDYTDYGYAFCWVW